MVVSLVVITPESLTLYESEAEPRRCQEVPVLLPDCETVELSLVSSM